MILHWKSNPALNGPMFYDSALKVDPALNGPMFYVVEEKKSVRK